MNKKQKNKKTHLKKLVLPALVEHHQHHQLQRLSSSLPIKPTNPKILSRNSRRL